MATEKRSIDERIAELKEKQNQLKAQEKKLRAKKSTEERKIRTRHLIEVGGTIYSVLGREFVEGDVERLAAFLKGQDNRGGYFTKAMNDFLPAPAVVAPDTAEPKTENE